ncbi:uncharacterized protein LOC114963081 isoform X1 [Acropora millepora]|nr:uncharacterized protein LOC114963081 isoform X1 [Acropora millepora]
MASYTLSIFQSIVMIFHLVVGNGYLSLDENLTRHKIATVLENPVNLGCYVTNLSHISKTLTFVWMKDNTTVTQSAALSIHGNVLVVTPKSEKDFGVYNCEVTNGVSQTRCQIKLVQGWKNSAGSVAGCINVSVLMPVLAVAVLSCLLLVHLVIRRKEPKILMHQRRRKSTSSLTHPHAEQRKRSRDLLYNSFRESGTLNNNEKRQKQEVVSIEMHMEKNDGGTDNPTENGLNDGHKEKLRSDFSSRSFKQQSMDVDNSEVTSQSSEESKNSGADKSSFYQKSFTSSGTFDSRGDRGFVPRASADAILSESKTRTPHAFYNKTYANESMDSSDGDVFASVMAETVGIDAPQGGKAKGFINKAFKTDSMARVELQATTSASEEGKTEHAPDMDTYF